MAKTYIFTVLFAVHQQHYHFPWVGFLHMDRYCTDCVMAGMLQMTKDKQNLSSKTSCIFQGHQQIEGFLKKKWFAQVYKNIFS